MNKLRNRRPHTALGAELGHGDGSHARLAHRSSLKLASIQLVWHAGCCLQAEVMVVDLWAQLSMIPYLNEMLQARHEGRDEVRL